MKDTIIMFWDGDNYIYTAKSIDECKYWFNRRIEKWWWVAEEAYWVDSKTNKLKIDNWAREYYDECDKYEKEQKEEEEKKQYEKLKKKYW